MKLFEFLTTNTADLPKERPANEDYPDYLHSIFGAFIQGLTAVEGGNELTNRVKDNLPLLRTLSDAIEETVRKYYAGLPEDAGKHLANWIDSNRTPFVDLYSNPLEPKVLAKIYRIRTQHEGDISREQMFHIPFDLRHRVETQRYSIPGYPCLYAGSSLYICWEELRRPKFDSVFSVRLEAQESTRILDFGYNPKMLAAAVKAQICSGTNNISLLKALLPKILFWPLTAACAIRVLHRQYPFKPEYIIPQLLLQYVKEDTRKEIDGIRYFSTHYRMPHGSLEIGCNFVFPVKTSLVSGLCPDLKQLFKVTEVLSWQIAGHIQLPHGPYPHPNTEIELLKGHSCPYATTSFGKMDEASCGMPAAFL